MIPKAQVDTQPPASLGGEVSTDPPPAASPPARKTLAAVDFFSALQRSLDAGQRQLSTANNAFADFVVKEFTIDAALQMNVNELGVLQLMLADDTMSPQSVSRVSMTLAAVAKAPDGSPPESTARADVTPLADLNWMPPATVEQLAQYDIKTASEFLGLIADARFSTQITSLLKVDRADSGRWANQVRLLELPEITPEAVGQLGQLGIFTYSDLAALDENAISGLQGQLPPTIPPELLAKWRDSATAALPASGVAPTSSQA